MEAPQNPSRRDFLKGTGAAAMATTLAADAPKVEAQDDFDRQYIKNISIGGVKTATLDATPEDLKDPTAVLLAPAWATPMEIYKPGVKELMKDGRHVLSLDHPRSGDTVELTDEQRETLKDFPSEVLRKASQFLDLLKQKGADAEHPVDVVAHSEGCLNAIAAALAEPERFRNIVLFAPPGFSGEDSMRRLSIGWLAEMTGWNGAKSLDARPASKEERDFAKARGQVAIDYPKIEMSEETKKVFANVLSEGAGYIAENPLRAVREIQGIAAVQLLEHIQPLRARGIGVVIMSGVDDSVFPIQEMEKIIGKDKVDGFLAVRGKHGQISETPEYHMHAAALMLKRLAARKKNVPHVD